MRRSYEPCLCGATDCPICGPLQSYEVVRQYIPGQGYVWVNPEEEDEGSEEDDECLED